jgi:glutamine synthetase
MVTRRRGVAPGQCEVAPRFAHANIAIDRNLLMMEVLRKTARRHGLAALLHEKPFKGVNGSGKHNNWSFGTNLIPTVLNPGDHPENNPRFMLFLAATLRAVDCHSDLLRWSISGAGNDHRLGANEAPPAIISAYLGDDIRDSVDRFIKRERTPSTMDLKVNLGVPELPPLTRAPTDRNRTSPFAFTGNKFEFRAVGAGQTASRSNMILNTILADSLRFISGEIAAAMKKHKNIEEAVETVARATLHKHRRVIFNGNNYSKEWHEEASKRGLFNLRTTPDALGQFNSPKNVQLFADMNVMTKEELDARSAVGYAEYCHKIVVEARCMTHLALNYVVPAALEYQRILAQAGAAASKAALSADMRKQTALLESVTQNINSVLAETSNLAHIIEEAEALELAPQSRHHADRTIPVMLKIREAADALEKQVPSKLWPLPTYHEMLFHQD